jgi:DNA-binding MarR family transcriptional regulator
MVKGARLSYLLRQAQLANRQELDAVVQAFGLTPSQYMVLGIIEEHREGVSSAALARRLGVTPQSSYEMVIELERRGLIRRSEETGTRRILKMSLTPKGIALLRRCDKEVASFEERFYARLSPSEVETLRGLLTRLIRDNRERAVADSLAATGTR